MLNETQLDKIVRRLNMHGYITRNECLQMFITRLGAHICTLEKMGYKFQAKYVTTPNGKDYKYTWLKDGQASLL